MKINLFVLGIFIGNLGLSACQFDGQSLVGRNPDHDGGGEGYLSSTVPKGSPDLNSQRCKQLVMELVPIPIQTPSPSPSPSPSNPCVYPGVRVNSIFVENDGVLRIRLGRIVGDGSYPTISEMHYWNWYPTKEGIVSVVEFRFECDQGADYGDGINKEYTCTPKASTPLSPIEKDPYDRIQVVLKSIAFENPRCGARSAYQMAVVRSDCSVSPDSDSVKLGETYFPTLWMDRR